MKKVTVVLNGRHHVQRTHIFSLLEKDIPRWIKAIRIEGLENVVNGYNIWVPPWSVAYIKIEIE